MATEGITVERVGTVVVAHLDDGKANALSPTMLAGIKGVVVDAEAGASAGAVVLHGRPNVLSGGFDLKIIRGDDHAARANMVADGGDIVRTCYGAGLPVIAACTGHAVAAGALLLLGCDLRVGAAGDFNIGLPEVNMGMSLPGWAVTIASDRLSRRHLQRALTHGEMYGPDAAVDVGYLDEVTDAGAVLDTAVAAGERLAQNMDRRAYAGIVASLRDDVLTRMDADVAASRS